VAFDRGRCGWRTYFDRLVGGDEQLIGHGEAERLGGLEIDCKFELCRIR
jgi:hypothetical protein